MNQLTSLLLIIMFNLTFVFTEIKCSQYHCLLSPLNKWDLKSDLRSLHYRSEYRASSPNVCYGLITLLLPEVSNCDGDLNTGRLMSGYELHNPLHKIKNRGGDLNNGQLIFGSKMPQNNK